jgi:hypothetical protein
MKSVTLFESQHGDLVLRNEASLVLMATLVDDDQETNLLLSADTTHEVWADIVNISKYKGNQDRLAWDIFKLPHHCSYKSLGPEKGKTETEPIAEVKWLLDQGQTRGIIISSSKVIPETDETQPPHFQAAAVYKKLAKEIDGEFIVTMEHPTKSAPDKLIIKISGNGAMVKKSIIVGGAAITSRPAPRAG